MKLWSIVLAAGLGSRFGGGKLTAPWGEGLLIDGALDAAVVAPVEGVTVVVGADPGVARIAALRGAEVVVAEDYAEGIAASLRAGIASMPKDCDGAFVFLGDMPRVPHAVFPPLAAAFLGHDAAAPVFDGQRGHPVLMGRALFQKLLALNGDQGAGAVLAALGDRLALVPAPDDGVLFDVDEHPAHPPVSSRP